MTESEAISLARLLDEAGTKEAIAALKAELTAGATSRRNTPEQREEKLHMLWGFQALLIKLNAQETNRNGV